MSHKAKHMVNDHEIIAQLFVTTSAATPVTGHIICYHLPQTNRSVIIHDGQQSIVYVPRKMHHGARSVSERNNSKLQILHYLLADCIEGKRVNQ
jgi:hypothetical protein